MGYSFLNIYLAILLLNACIARNNLANRLGNKSNNWAFLADQPFFNDATIIMVTNRDDQILRYLTIIKGSKVSMYRTNQNVSSNTLPIASAADFIILSD